MTSRRGERVLRLLLARWAPLLLPLVLLSLVLYGNPVLRQPAVWARVGRTWAGVAVLAIGMTPIIITGGIDLSVGSVVGLAVVVTGALWHGWGLPLAVALGGGLAAGLAAGLLNGGLILAGINPLVVTLATLGVFRGLAYGVSGPEPVRGFPAGLGAWWNGTYFGLPHPTACVLLAFVAVYLFLHHTWMGRMVFALGDNARAARFAAVPVRALTFSLYALNGLLAGAVGLAAVCEFGSAWANEGEGLELQAIACVVLGGVRITGGAGHLAGTLLGTLTLAALGEGLAQVAGSWQLVYTGVFLVAIAIANEGLARLRSRWEAAAGTTPR